MRELLISGKASTLRRKAYRHLNSKKLPKEVVDAPSLDALKARLDVALGSLVWWFATLHIAGGLKLYDPCGPCQPRPFYDSISENSALLCSSFSSPHIGFCEDDCKPCGWNGRTGCKGRIRPWSFSKHIQENPAHDQHTVLP